MTAQHTPEQIILTQQELKDLLSYDPETGFFMYVQTRGPYKTGSTAGSINKRGYVRIAIKGKCYLAHRLAFLYMTGGFPENDIDHINGITYDNSWVNLRKVTKSENLRNKKRRKDNRSGFNGVNRHAKCEAWEVQVWHKSKKRTLLFSDSKYGGKDNCLLLAADFIGLLHKELGYHENNGRVVA